MVGELDVVFGDVAVVEMEGAEVSIDIVASDIVVDAHKKGAVTDHEDVGGIWLFGFDVLEYALGTVECILERLAITEVGVEMKVEKIFGPGGRVGAFELAEAALLQIVVKNNGTAVVDDDLGGLGGAEEGRSIANVEAIISELVTQGFGLLDAGGVERNIGLALGDAL